MKKLLILAVAAFFAFGGLALAQNIEKDVEVTVDKDGNKMIWISEDGEEHELIEEFEFIGRGDRRGHGERFGFRNRDCGHECQQCDGRGQKGRRGGRKGGRGHGEGMFRMFHGLDLTDAQQDQIKDMRLKFQMEKIDLQADIKKAGLQLKALKQENDVSEREVFAAIDKLAGLKADLQKMRYTHHNSYKDILTAEQLEKLEGFKKDRPAKQMKEKKIIKKFKGGRG